MTSFDKEHAFTSNLCAGVRNPVETKIPEFTGKSALYPKGSEPEAFGLNLINGFHWRQKGSERILKIPCRSEACAKKLSTAFGRISEEIGGDYNINATFGPSSVTASIPDNEMDAFKAFANAKIKGENAAAAVAAVGSRTP